METVDQIVKRLTRMKRQFPKSPRVTRFVVEDRPDWYGEPSLYIDVLLESGTPEPERAFEHVQPIRRMIADSIFDRKDPRFPFIRFLTEEEYDEVLKASGRA